MGLKNAKRKILLAIVQSKAYPFGRQGTVCLLGVSFSPEIEVREREVCHMGWYARIRAILMRGFDCTWDPSYQGVFLYNELKEHEERTFLPSTLGGILRLLDATNATCSVWHCLIRSKWLFPFGLESAACEGKSVWHLGRV